MLLKKLKILLLEDSLLDAELNIREIKRAHIVCEPLVVTCKADYIKSLSAFSPDIILSDHALPSFTSLEALKLAEEKLSKVPFIVVTGAMSEEFAVGLMKAGAWDYVLKNNLQKLPDAIVKAMEKFEYEKLRKKFLYDLILNEAYMEEAERIAGYGSWEVDVINKKLKLSKEAHHILGFTQGGSEALLENIMDIVHADELHHMKRIIEQVMNNPNDEIYKENVRLVDKNGSLRFVKTEFALKHGLQNKLLRVNGFIKNITDSISLEEKLLESEERFCSLAESIPDVAIIVLNASGNILSANKEAEMMLEYSGEELKDKPFSAFYAKSENQNDDIINHMKVRIDIGRFKTRSCFATKTGVKIWTNILITTQTTKWGKLFGYIIDMRKSTHSNGQTQSLGHLINEPLKVSGG